VSRFFNLLRPDFGVCSGNDTDMHAVIQAQQHYCTWSNYV